MGKLLSGVFVLSTLALACTSKTNEKMNEDTQQGSAKSNVETKTNTSSSAAKSNGQGDSTVVIKPIHKYRHQKKIKIK
jgi:hypothetical protein